MKSLVFFGELPPRTIHGASISNKINVDILKKKYSVTVIEEFSDLKYHNNFSTRKLKAFLSSWLLFFSKILRQSYGYFYGVVYLSSLGVCKNIAAVLVFKLRNPKSKVILHFHRSDLAKFLALKRNQVLFKILCYFVSKFILLSERQRVLFGNFEQSKLSVLHNTIEREYNVEEFERKEKFEGEISIIYIGNYIKDKGILDLIKAVKLINSEADEKVVLSCYGNFTNAEFELLLRKEIEGVPYVFLNGQITGKEKFEVLYNANILVLPTYNEGLPLVLLESLYVGTPLIISDVGFVNEALGDSYPFYCIPGDIESIIDCMMRIKMHFGPDFSKVLKQKYLPFSHQEHSEKLLEIFS